MSRTALYRFYDAAGDLLYVGISVTPWARWKQHKGEKDWAQDVVTSTMEWFDTRAEALAAEKAAIIAEEPRYNIVHNVRPAAPAAPVVSVICTGCRAEIDDGDGIIQVDSSTARRRHFERRARLVAEEREREELGLTSWDAIDLSRALGRAERGPVPWEAFHHRCDPQPEGLHYHFTVDQVRYLDDLFDWIGHLGEKPWIGETNWTDMLRQVAWTGRVQFAGIQHVPPILAMAPEVLGSPRATARPGR